MKGLVGIFPIIILSGCVSTYQGSDSTTVAYISVPKNEANYKFIGGFSGQNVAIGDIDSKGCMVNVQRIKDASLNEDGLLVVPAGKEIGLSVSSYQGNNTCGLGLAVTLKPNKEYELSFGQGYTMCGLGITSKEKVAPHEKVESQRLLPGFSKLCKK